MLRSLLFSPNFIYRPEIDQNLNSTTAQPLNAYELASRLSYFLWASTPDEQLLSAAANGSLLNDATIRSQVARMLEDPNVLKLFHFGRFDIAAMYNAFGALTAPVYCTKIASRLIRTYTDRHGLKNLLQEVLNVDVSKQQQSSDWGAERLTKAQIEYAASDVLHLHQLRTALDLRLQREGRMETAQACFDFLPTRAKLDLAGWPDTDIFAHS
ncbi:MAG: DUF1592 domain-containing protein [Planktomarina sp.]